MSRLFIWHSPAGVRKPMQPRNPQSLTGATRVSRSSFTLSNSRNIVLYAKNDNSGGEKDRIRQFFAEVRRTVCLAPPLPCLKICFKVLIYAGI